MARFSAISSRLERRYLALVPLPRVWLPNLARVCLILSCISFGSTTLSSSRRLLVPGRLLSRRGPLD